jgi:hypothetical protein
MSAPRDDVIGAARLAVQCAARLLPTPADRRRYQAEFVAELYGMPAGAQLRHATGVLAQVHALRTSLGSTDRLPVVLGPPAPASRRFLCRYLRWHNWRTFRTDDGARYSACAVCGRFPTDTVSRNSFIG